jgi:hypothetical protein
VKARIIYLLITLAGVTGVSVGTSEFRYDPAWIFLVTFGGVLCGFAATNGRPL